MEVIEPSDNGETFPSFDNSHTDNNLPVNNDTERTNLIGVSSKEQCCIECTTTFKSGQVYPSPKDLHEAVVDFACLHNFSISKNGREFRCSRAIDRSKEKQRQKKVDMGLMQRNKMTLKVGCPFKISWKYTTIISKHLRPPGQENKQTARRSDECAIVKVCGEHGECCELSTQELQVTLKRGGFLTKFQSHQMVNAVNIIASDPSLPAKAVRALMREHFPPGCNITPQDTVNFRIWCRVNQPKLQQEGHKVTLNPSEIGCTLKRWSGEESPPMVAAGETLQAVIKSKLNDRSGIWEDKWEVEVFLNEMKKRTVDLITEL
jgi:hypothetical protein